MNIPMRHLVNKCAIGQGKKCCAFIGSADGAWQCLKGTEAEATVRQRLAEKSMRAQGDNCPGLNEDGTTVH